MVMTPVDYAAIGAFSGTVEVCLLQPTVAIKNAVQEGRPIPTNPLHLYRGLTMNCVSMAPITATQFGSNFAYNSLHAMITGRDKMTKQERLVTGAAAGATSALMATPTELVVISQQQSGRPLLEEVKHIIREHGYRSFMSGVSSAAVREAIYGCCWMEVMPNLHDVFSSSAFVRDSLPAGAAHVMSGISAGLLGATLSHPFDTIKTRMQAFIAKSHPRHDDYNTVTKATRSILREDGFMAMFHGLAPRAFRITCAVFILSFCRNEVSPRYEKAKTSLFG